MSEVFTIGRPLGIVGKIIFMHKWGLAPIRQRLFHQVPLPGAPGHKNQLLSIWREVWFKGVDANRSYCATLAGNPSAASFKREEPGPHMLHSPCKRQLLAIRRNSQFRIHSGACRQTV